MMRASTALRIVLMGLCLGFGGIIVDELNLVVGDVTAAPTEAAPAPDRHEAKPAELDAAGLAAAILRRPLFTPGRQPPAPPPGVDAAASSAMPEFKGRLAGVMIRPGAREALFVEDGKDPVPVRQGEMIQGWTVTVIEADHVDLTSARGVRRLEPTDGPRPGAQAPPISQRLLPQRPEMMAGGRSSSPVPAAAAPGAFPIPPNAAPAPNARRPPLTAAPGPRGNAARSGVNP